MDFDLTFSEKENQNSLTEQDLKKEVNIENTSLEPDLEQAGLDVEFELKSESDKNFISQKNIDESGFNSELKNNSNPFEQSIDQTISSQSESRKAHLKAYNHQFSHQYQKVEEFEKEPAYKRKDLISTIIYLKLNLDYQLKMTVIMNLRFDQIILFYMTT